MKNQNINESVLRTGVNRKRLVIPSLLLAAAALITTSLTSFAQQAGVFTAPFDNVVTGPELPTPGAPGDCPEINWPLHLTGTLQFVVLDTVRHGLHQLAFHQLVKGIATDALGNTFVFSYANNFRSSFESTLAVTVVDFDTDHFNMEGPAGHVSLGFVGELLLSADGSFLGVSVDHTHGNWVCDPI